MIYYYESLVGTFYIKENADTGKYDLTINDELYCSDYEPNALADNVYSQSTGYWDWDSLESIIGAPTDIHQWERLANN
jgi:hypothetical protein